jgi:hypothetical protein
VLKIAVNSECASEKGGMWGERKEIIETLSCFTSKLHVLTSETLAARGSIWKFEWQTAYYY